jgi:hypothetical protein
LLPLNLLKANISLVLFLLVFSGFSQTATLTGVVRDKSGEAVEQVAIGVKENPAQNTTSDLTGHYTLTIDAGKPIEVIFYLVNYQALTHSLIASPDEVITYSPKLTAANTLTEVEVTASGDPPSETYTLDAKKLFTQLPTPTGNIEDLIKTQIGVSSNNELSSAYSVRGGNFTENDVYVNGIRVYRPFLVRSGQQEGLSFANPYMVKKMDFYPGGFEARFGDKLSSVLDITYRKPLKFEGNASASFLGGNLQLEGVSKNRLVAWSVGGRYRSNVYLLKSLDTHGEYRPSALDFQTFLTFDFNPRFKLEYLGSIANNKYLVIPSDRETNFGTVNNALRFTVYFDGQELMQYTTFMNALSASFIPNNKTLLKFIASAYHTQEEEIYTVQGQYYIDQLEADLGQPNFGQVAYNRGIGTFINNGRNYLTADVYALEHKGVRQLKNNNSFLWGARYQFELIHDQLGEWRTVDSAGYIVPYNSSSIDLIDVYKTKITLPSSRGEAYAQYDYSKLLGDSSLLNITAGVRGNYWTVNQQLVVSPRITSSYRPHWKRDWLFRLSGGYYYQPPFYRELRDISGNINTNVKAQKSIQGVFTSEYTFRLKQRKFKLIMASYWKQLSSIIPYEIDNVRIRYFANNSAKGYATGADFRINGEFVPGVESWVNLGLLRTYEYSPDNIHYNYYNKEGEQIVKGYTFDQVKADSVKVDPGYIPRPTDQLLNFSMFFQDHLEKFPSIKFNLNLQFGSGLPFGPPTHLRWEQILRMPPYRRVDAGFAYNVIKEGREKRRKNAFNNLKEMWIFFEVFNLLQVQNTVSYTWIQDVTGNLYAIPNYLTNRQLNLRLQVRF